MKDIKSNINVVKGVAPAVISGNGASVSGIIDLLNYNAACVLLFSGARTDGTFTLSVEHGDAADLADAASAAAFLDHDANAGVISAADKYARTGFLDGIKRYVRLTVTGSAISGGGALVGCALIEGRPHDAPVAD